MHSAKYRDAHTCDTVFVNSEYTRQDVLATLGLDPARVHVAAPGVGADFGPDGARAELGGAYVLTVATLEPRKNLGVLLDAGIDSLVVAGQPGWGRLPHVGRHLGYVPDDELARLYRGADVFVYPSQFEGFGIPLLEAMACGVPVVASSHPSLDEAAGDAALRVDPDDPAAWRAAVDEARSRRDELVALGHAHAAHFTTRAMGEAILAAYEGVR
jgi:alpha-1,3-rhamnosyl/mannosyltransferase